MTYDTQKILLESGTNELEIVECRIDEWDRNGQIVPCFYAVNVAKVRETIAAVTECPTRASSTCLSRTSSCSKWADCT